MPRLYPADLNIHQPVCLIKQEKFIRNGSITGMSRDSKDVPLYMVVDLDTSHAHYAISRTDIEPRTLPRDPLPPKELTDEVLYPYADARFNSGHEALRCVVYGSTWHVDQDCWYYHLWNGVGWYHLSHRAITQLFRRKETALEASR